MKALNEAVDLVAFDHNDRLVGVITAVVIEGEKSFFVIEDDFEISADGAKVFSGFVKLARGV